MNNQPVDDLFRFYYDDVDDDEEYEDEWDDSRESDECCFPPGECLMPGEHLSFECYNLEMAEAWQEENEMARRSPTSEN